MSKKILTAEDILNESDSDDSESSSRNSSDEKAVSKPNSSNQVENSKIEKIVPASAATITPDARTSNRLPDQQEEEVKTSQNNETGIKESEQPEVDNRYANIQTSKSANAALQSIHKFKSSNDEVTADVKFGQTTTTGDNLFFQNFAHEKNGDNESAGSDEEPNFNTRRQSYRANQSVTYKSFTAGGGTMDDQKKVLLSSPLGNMMSSPLGKMSKGFDDVEASQEIDDAKLLRMIEQEDSDEDDSVGSGASHQEKEVKSNGSMVSEEDLLNRSLQSEGGDDAIDANNYLRYASDKVNQKFDLLDIVDKNERSFKQVAEKMMQQSSQLISAEVEMTQTQQRRLTHQKVFKKIADRFYNDQLQGVPLCIGSLEEYIGIGSTDGSVRLYDTSEQEIKTLIDKSIKGNPVNCIDIKRVEKNQNIFVVCGHNKGHVSIYEVKGLLQQQDLSQQQQKSTAGRISSQIGADNRGGAQTDVEVKHRKTLDDVHKNSVIQIKFVGDFQREIQTISCDISGLICITTFSDGLILFRASTQVFSKQRLGPAFSIAPLVSVVSKMQNALGLLQGGLKNQPLREQMARQLKFGDDKKEGEEEDKPQLVAFGSLDEIYVTQFKPSVIALLSVKRPAYIQSGTVPYLDWGLALTPTFRDQAYQCLAIAWGNAIQLVVYNNQKEVNKGLENPSLQLDGFYICECESIDSVFFLSESLIFIVVNKKDVKILYTQNFTPGVFDEQFSSKALNLKKVGASNQSEEEKQAISMYQSVKDKYAGQVSAYAEKDSGYKMVEDEILPNDYQEYFNVTSEQGPKLNFNVSVTKNFGFNVTALGKNQIVQRNLIHWEEYLDLIRRTSPDFLKVLKAALDIYNGKMIGLAGLPDQKEKREQLMRERMKDLLRQNINACIREFKEGQTVSQKTLRVATEFCIRVGSIDHIFGELFKMFADGGVEQMYFENLDSFILSGKLKAVKIPHKILERLIKYYRQKDVQLLEQALLNLDLTKYPGAEEVRFICEEEQLSSALIHVLTTIFQDEKESDSTTCLSILCSLFNIMMRAKHKKSQKDIQDLLLYFEKFGTSVFELSALDSTKIQEEDKQEVFKQSRAQKIEVEHSSTYIGYKILWIVTLYLEGKRFPQGNLSTLRWRYYVMDIVRFCTNERFMQWFLEFDPDSFFAMLKKVFNDPEPADFIVNQDTFIAEHRESNPFLEPCYAHADILTIFERKVAQMIAADKAENDQKLSQKGEALQNAFLFFLTQVARNKKIIIAKTLCLKIIREQIAFHKTLYRLPKKDLLDLMPESQLSQKVKDRTQNIYTYLIKKNEKDIIQILISHQSKLQQDEIQALLEDAKSSPLFKLKIFLHQLQGDFQKCLTLFFQIKAIKTDVFAWLHEIQHTLKGQDRGIFENEVEQAVDEEDDSNFFDVRGIGSRITFNKMKELITKNILDFVTMDPDKTVKLCDLWFDEDYMFIADELKDHKEIAFSFLQSVLVKNEQRIVAEYNQAVLQNIQSHNVSNKYKLVLLRLVEILAERRVKNSSKIIVDFVSRNYFPIEESLVICEKKGAIEASAVLYRRKGQYQKSIKLYISTIVTLCVEKLIHTIFVEKNIKFEDPLCTNEHMSTFDNLVQQIIKICSKYGSRQTEKEMEDLWMFAIKSLFEVKTEVFKKKREMEEPDSESDSSADRERHEEEMQFEKFVLIRNQHFLSKMSEHVNLRSVIQFLEQCGHAMKYDDFRRTFEDKIQTELYFISILDTAIKLVSKEVRVHCADIIVDYSKGQKIRSKCDSCHQNLVNKFDRQEIWIMSCQHSFHARCIAKTEGTCCVCFNELDVIHSFQQLRKEKSVGRNSASSSNIAGSTTESSNSARSSADINGQSDVDSIKQQREQSLKRSIDLANKQGQVKRRLETRDEKMNRLMNEYEFELNKRYLGKNDFLLI